MSARQRYNGSIEALAAALDMPKPGYAKYGEDARAAKADQHAMQNIKPLLQRMRGTSRKRSAQ
eukprot:1970667-Alexandrium_andersonii.AAC.1